MCGEYESRIKAKRVTLVLQSGEEIGPVKVVGLKEVGSMLEADIYGKPEVIADYPATLRFMAMYTNIKDKPKKPSAQ